jgi:hypothetical protein
MNMIMIHNSSYFIAFYNCDNTDERQFHGVKNIFNTGTQPHQISRMVQSETISLNFVAMLMLVDFGNIYERIQLYRE